MTKTVEPIPYPVPTNDGQGRTAEESQHIKSGIRFYVQYDRNTFQYRTWVLKDEQWTEIFTSAFAYLEQLGLF